MIKFEVTFTFYAELGKYEWKKIFHSKDLSSLEQNIDDYMSSEGFPTYAPKDKTKWKATFEGTH